MHTFHHCFRHYSEPASSEELAVGNNRAGVYVGKNPKLALRTGEYRPRLKHCTVSGLDNLAEVLVCLRPV